MVLTGREAWRGKEIGERGVSKRSVCVGGMKRGMMGVYERSRRVVLCRWDVGGMWEKMR